jgi:hypothetical protein
VLQSVKGNILTRLTQRSLTFNFHYIDGLTMAENGMPCLSARPLFLPGRNSRMIGLLGRPGDFAEGLAGFLWMYFLKC